MGIGPIVLCVVMLWSSTVLAGNGITCYRDGALIRQEATGVRGIIDHPGVVGLIESTLRIEPAPGTRITGVEIYRSPAVTGTDKERDSLLEQRRKCEDRLLALETREAIFTSAAKAQSGKAPRRTKTNPDPMQTIRQGTDFAIAQLESVYTSRRRTLHEIEKIDGRIAALTKGNHAGGSSLRVTVSPPKGKVTIQYATTEFGWHPSYAMLLNGTDSVTLEMSPEAPPFGRGYQRQFYPGSLHDPPPFRTATFPTDGSAPPVSYQLTLANRREEKGIFNVFSGVVTNRSGMYLPPGNCIILRNGSYVGKFPFKGLSSGRSSVIKVGSQ